MQNLIASSRVDIDKKLTEESTDQGEQDEIFRQIRKSIYVDEAAVDRAVLHEQLELMKQTPKIRMPKRYGLLACVSILLGAIMGSAILSEPNLAMQSVGSFQTALILWMVYGVIATFGALSYGGIAADIPASGGDYSYLLILVGEFAGFAYQVGANFFVVPCLKAIMGIQFAKYALEIVRFTVFFDDNKAAQSLPLKNAVICLAIVFILWATHLCCTKCYTRIVVTYYIFYILTAIAFVLICAAASWGGEGIASIKDLRETYVSPEITSCINLSKCVILSINSEPGKGASTITKFFALAQGMFQVAFAFQGWNTLSFITEEIKHSSKNLVKAAGITLPLITLLYLALNFSYGIILTTNEIHHSNVVSMLALDIAIKNSTTVLLAIPLSLCLFAVLLTYVNASGRVSIVFISLAMVTLFRIALVGSRNGHFPKIFSLLHMNHMTPGPSILFTSWLSIVYVVLLVLLEGGVGSFLGAVVYQELFCSCFVVGGHILARLKKKKDKNVAASKIFIGIPITYFLFTFPLLLTPFITVNWTFQKSFRCGWKDQMFLVSGVLVTILLSIPTYFFFIRKKWEGNKYERALITAENSIALFLQRLFILVKESEGIGEDEPPSPGPTITTNPPSVVSSAAKL